jgi:hypothetical protein
MLKKKYYKISQEGIIVDRTGKMYIKIGEMLFKLELSSQMSVEK